MVYLVSLLPVLLCPLGMGLMLWLMRDGHDAMNPSATAQPAARPAHFRAASLVDLVRCCMNWGMVAALLVLAGALWLVAPGYAWVAVPLLLVAICPLSMLLMLRGRRSHVDQAHIVEAPRLEQLLHLTKNTQGEYEPTP